MATIEQIIRIAANEDRSEAASTAASNAATAASNAQTTATNAQTTADAAQTTANAAQTTANAALPTANINTAGQGYVTFDNNMLTFSAPTAINLNNVVTFSTATARNASLGPNNVANSTDDVNLWHEGDIAIVTTTSDVVTSSGFEDTGFNFTAFLTSTTFRSDGAWDTAADAPVSNLGFGVGDTIRFRAAGGTTFAGSGAGGTDFIVTDIAQVSTSSNAVITLNRGYFPADGVSPAPANGDDIFAVSSTTVSVPSATYVFTGTNQTTSGITTNADWTSLTVPAGTASTSDLPTFSSDDGTTVNPLSTLVYNGSALTINGTSITTGGGSSGTIERNHYGYQGPTLTITGLPAGSTAGPQTFVVDAGSTNWALNFGSETVPNNWPQNATLYGNGLKLFYGTDWVFSGTNRNQITITISQAQRIEGGMGFTEDLSLEVETLTFS